MTNELTQWQYKNNNFSINFSKAVPKNIGTAYKLFYLKDGKLYPPMVGNPNGEPTPVGAWIDASIGKLTDSSKTGRSQVLSGGPGTHKGSKKGHLALRPGWHLGVLPVANQFNITNPKNGKKELFPAELVWAEVEYSMDKNYQQDAMKEGMTENGNFRYSYAGMKELPVNGYYRYKTNPDPKTEEWIIAGQIKVKRVLTNEEVDKILIQNGRTPPKRITQKELKKLKTINIYER